MAIGTVSELITQARVLLQDTIVDYRYSDAELLVALSMAMLEARRIRPDLFIDDLDDVPTYSANDNTVIAIDQQYRPGLLYYVVGMAQLRDDDQATDQRAGALLGRFTAQLLTTKA